MMMDEREVIAEYATNHQQAIDAHEIVDDIYRHAENFMHARGTVMQPDYVGKTGGPVSLVLDQGVEDVPAERVSDA